MKVRDGFSRPPWTPHYAKDWIAKTTGLSLEEEGAYTRLCNAARVQSEDWYSLPDDDRICARICAVSVTKWKRVRKRLVPEFFSCEGGRLVHGRLREIAAEQRAKLERASIAGRASAVARGQRVLNGC